MAVPLRITYQPNINKTIDDGNNITTTLILNDEQMAGIWYGFWIYHRGGGDTMLTDIIQVDNFQHLEIPFPHSDEEIPDLINPYSEYMREDPNTLWIHDGRYDKIIPNPLTRSMIEEELSIGLDFKVDMRYTAFIGNDRNGYVVMFDTPEFMQGYLTACSWLNVTPEYHSITDGKIFYRLEY